MAKGKSKKTKVVTGIDISRLSKSRPTKIPQAKVETGLPDEPVSFKKIAIHLGIIAVLVLIAYGFSAAGQFVLQDDYIQQVLRAKITTDNFWSQLGLKAIGMPLMQSWLITNFALDFQSFGLQPVWYHLVNIVLHIASCCYFYALVFFLARKREKVEALDNLAYEVPFLAAALLACHPLAAESVAHITGREGTLVAANVFLSLLFFVYAFWAETSTKMTLSYICSLVFFMMGVWSGPESLAIPALAVTTILLLRPESIKPGEWARQTWPEIVIVVLLMVSILILPFLGVGNEFVNDIGAPALTPPLYYASQLRSLVVYYLRTFLVPFGLSVVPPYVSSNGAADPFVYIGLAVLLAAAWILQKLRNHALPAFGIAVFLFSLLPNILIVQPEVAADRRFYIPLAGLSLIVAYYVARYTRGKRFARVAIPVALCLTLTGLTIWRTLAWQSNLSLWQSTSATNANDPYVQGMLARTYLETGKVDQAGKLAEEALKLQKNNVMAYLTLGSIKMNAKDYAGADELFSKALTLANDNHLGELTLDRAELGVAEAQLNLGKFDKARDLAMRVLMRDRNDIQANLIMGKSLIGLKQPRYALTFLNYGYKPDQMNPTYLEPIAEAGLDSGIENLVRNAFGAARLAMRVMPTENVERIYAQSALETGRIIESQQTIDSLLKKQPQNAKYLYLKSCVEKQLGNDKSAETYKKQALKIDPDVEKNTSIKIFSKGVTSPMPGITPGVIPPAVIPPREGDKPAR